MPSTTPWAIPYPDGPTNLTALQSHFANIANAINTALTSGLGGAPRLANSDAERLTLFPAPVQGNSVVRPDKGWTEQYFALYNASTNPSGATPAGWYPISGMVPRGIMKRTATACNSGNSAYGNIGLSTMWTSAAASGGTLQGGMVYTDGWVVPISGIYHVTYSIMTSGAIPLVTGMTKNAGAVNGDRLIAGVSAPNTGAILAAASADVPLVAGDVLKLWAYGQGGIAGMTSSDGPTFSITYLGPNR